MQVKLIYYTPEYHKLIEGVARVCYQSYDKLSPTSHSMIKGIMKKGHLSVASVGNVVFEVDIAGASSEDMLSLLETMAAFKEINNYIRWTTPTNKKARQDVITISMNLLTLLDIIDNIVDYNTSPFLLDGILGEVSKVPCLAWLCGLTDEIPASDSPYIGEPKLRKPVILTEDYTTLKDLGLTEYELEVHSTFTVDFVTDRASGLQTWRHADMTGGCELSQRYCDLSNAEVREMEGVNKYPEGLAEYAEKVGITYEEATQHYDAVMESIYNRYTDTIKYYSDTVKTLKELGVSGKRAKEIARSVLPNAITTRIIQCRPLKQWKHFIDLRATVHAQPEIQQDAKAVMKAFTKVGVEL